MKLLVVGSGAREHAIVRSLLSESDSSGARHQIEVVGGNGGLAELVPCHAIDPADPALVSQLAVTLGVELVIIGPEAPLVAGVADAVRAAGILCFGPSAEAAQLEGSKAFAKEVMAEADVPTAMARVCRTPEQVDDALDTFGAPHVVKEDGLAAGKGVVVTDDRDEALAHALACLHEGSGQVVIEEFLDGPEVSLFCLSDGVNVVPLAPAQDFKRVGDNDAGANTGGMGAYSPLPWVPETLVAEVVERVALPTISHMHKRGTPFVGVLYCGLALTSRGVRVIEFNARFGDPETQVVLARLETPLSEVLLAAAQGTLGELAPLRWNSEAAVTVVVAAENYPGTPVTGDLITGLDPRGDAAASWVLHAGTQQAEGGIVSSGGRVLSVVGMGTDLGQARERAYARVAQIGLRGSHHRSDIAQLAAEGAITVPTR